MPLLLEELAESPTFSFNRDGASAQRLFRVEWDDIPTAIEQLLGLSFAGVTGEVIGPAARMPGFPALYADGIAVEPWMGSPPDFGTDPEEEANTYSTNGAKVTVSYKTADAQEDEDQPFATQKLAIGGEIITLPNRALVWDDDNENELDPDVSAGLINPTADHVWSWRAVQSVPFGGISACIGKINASEFLGVPAGRLLFQGGEVSRDFVRVGASYFTLDYKFSERVRDWNEFLDPNSGTWKRIKQKDGTPLYSTANFSTLTPTV